MLSLKLRQLFTSLAATLTMAPTADFVTASNAIAAPRSAASSLPPCPPPPAHVAPGAIVPPRHACINNFVVHHLTVVHHPDQTSHESDTDTPLPYAGHLTNVPALDAPPYKAPNGTYYMSAVGGAQGEPAIVRTTFIANKGYGLSVDSSIEIDGMRPNSSIRETRHFNDGTVSLTNGVVEVVRDQEGGGIGVHAVVTSTRAQLDPHFQLPSDPTERARADANTMGAATARFNSALAVAMVNHLLEAREYPSNYVSVVPAPPTSQEDLAHRPRRVIVQVGDWRFDMSEHDIHGVKGYDRPGAPAERIEANGDLLETILIGRKNMNLNSLRYYNGRNWIEEDPRDTRRIESNRYGTTAGDYSDTYQPHTAPENEAAFGIVMQAVNAARNTFNEFPTYFYGLPKGAGQAPNYNDISKLEAAPPDVRSSSSASSSSGVIGQCIYKDHKWIFVGLGYHDCLGPK